MEILRAAGIDDKLARRLLSLKYAIVEGSPYSASSIVDLDRRDVLIEVISLARKEGDNAIFFLEKVRNPDDILWGNPLLDEVHEKSKQELRMLRFKVSGVKGAGTCRYCGHNELMFKSMQTRSGDEATTIFVQCTSARCGKKWRE